MEFIGEAVGDIIRNLFWGMITVLMSMVKGMIDAMINGVLSFGILNSQWVVDAFNMCITVMFLLLPVKIIYEILFAILTDNEQATDYGKKIFGCITAIMIAISLPTAIPLFNNITVESAQAITGDIASNNNKLGTSLISSVYVGFGGMPENGKYGAKKLVDSYTKGDFDITQREDGVYVWDFSEFMVIIGLAIYTVLIFAITIQIAGRIFMIAMLYILGPICLTSLTKYQDPQAFNVWKNSILGQMAMNFIQIMSLSFLANMVEAISNIGTSTFTGVPVVMAQLALYLGAFSFIITMPKFVQAMIGGYSSGIMESMNELRSGFSLGKAATIGLAGATVASTVGRRNSYTGYREGGLRGLVAGNKRQNGTRTGGIVGNTIGNKDVDGNRQGGIRGAVMGDTLNRNGTSIRSGGLVGAFRGSKATSQGKDGTVKTSLSGGLRGAVAGATMMQAAADGAVSSYAAGGLAGIIRGTKQVQQAADGSSQTVYEGGIRGAYEGTRITGSHGGVTYQSGSYTPEAKMTSKGRSSVARQSTGRVRNERVARGNSNSGLSSRRNQGGRR